MIALLSLNRWVMLRVLGFLFAVMVGTVVQGEPLRVFAAASLRGALDEVNATYFGDVRVAYAASSVLARQIAQGAPADIYISASPDWMDELEGNGFLVAGTRRDLLGNALVVAGQGRRLETLADLPDALEGGRLAVALTMAVPAGQYAQQALENAGLWPVLSHRLAEVDNVRAAAALITRGETRLGIVYRTDALAFDEIDIAFAITSRLHDPIRYPVARISGSSDEAEVYLTHLSGAQAQSVFAAHGFEVIR